MYVSPPRRLRLRTWVTVTQHTTQTCPCGALACLHCVLLCAVHALCIAVAAVIVRASCVYIAMVINITFFIFHCSQRVCVCVCVYVCVCMCMCVFINSHSSSRSSQKSGPLKKTGTLSPFPKPMGLQRGALGGPPPPPSPPLTSFFHVSEEHTANHLAESLNALREVQAKVRPLRGGLYIAPRPLED
jgi:hypothetical protein